MTCIIMAHNDLCTMTLIKKIPAYHNLYNVTYNITLLPTIIIVQKNRPFRSHKKTNCHKLLPHYLHCKLY